jgi:hypothetical protein
MSLAKKSHKYEELALILICDGTQSTNLNMLRFSLVMELFNKNRSNCELADES